MTSTIIRLREEPHRVELFSYVSKGDNGGYLDWTLVPRGNWSGNQYHQFLPSAVNAQSTGIVKFPKKR